MESGSSALGWLKLLLEKQGVQNLETIKIQIKDERSQIKEGGKEKKVAQEDAQIKKETKPKRIKEENREKIKINRGEEGKVILGLKRKRKEGTRIDLPRKERKIGTEGKEKNQKMEPKGKRDKRTKETEGKIKTGKEEIEMEMESKMEGKEKNQKMEPKGK